MIGNDLFRRLFVRFLIGLGTALMAFLVLVHLFQVRIIDREWREDLRQQAYWLALHSRAGEVEILCDAWRKTHSTLRLTFFDQHGEILADSQPELPIPELAALTGGMVRGHLASVEPVRWGGSLVISRPWIPAFPYGLQWELVVAALTILVLVIACLYPLVRSMSATLQDLTRASREVSSGHFGKVLKVDRSDQLGELVQAFNDMSEKLAEAEQLNTRLLHDVSHELRSPLARIQVMAQTITLRPSEAEECIRGIEQEVALLDRLVGDLVDVSRIESEVQAGHQQSFSLRQWADETLRRLEKRARSNSIHWHQELPQVDLQIQGDPQRLAQALANLVDNAMTALDGRANAQIQVQVQVEPESWSIQVQDNGPGIPSEHLPHVFRRFYRADQHRDRSAGGVGLGLSLVRAIVEAHGGQASIESTLGSGTRCTLSLPAPRHLELNPNASGLAE
jgi:signal transduction histidine kinase